MGRSINIFRWFRLSQERWKMGYINKTGKIPINVQFADAFSFHEGLAAVKPEGSENFGFINKKGEIIIRPQYSKIHYYLKQKIYAEKDGKIIVADYQGKKIFEGMWQEITPFVNGIALYKKNELYGYIIGDQCN